MKGEKLCKDCGGPAPRRRGRQYCEACTAKRKAESGRRWRTSKGRRLRGTVAGCALCGVSIALNGGSHRYCRACGEIRQKQRIRRYRERNPERALESGRRSGAKRRSNPEYVAAQREYQRAVSSPARSRKRREDPRENIDHRMSQLVRSGLKARKAGRSWPQLVGYSIEELMRHLERQFQKGMTWENKGEWEIDHILPRASFSYDSHDSEEFRACWALTNLRPVWSKVNRSKGPKRLLLL